jgi:hypothetical protein
MTSPRSSSSPLRSSLASGGRACDEGNLHGDVPHVCACGPERLVMPHPCLSHPVRLQPPCASPRLLRWPPAAVRARQLRWARLLRVGVTGLGRLTGTVAKELTDSKLVKWFTDVDGLLSVDWSIDFVDSQWARTSVLSLGQLVGHLLRHQHSTTY